jgi:hypothetical protein
LIIRDLQSVFAREDAELAAVDSDQAQLLGTDTIVDPRFRRADRPFTSTVAAIRSSDRPKNRKLPRGAADGRSGREPWCGLDS